MLVNRVCVFLYSATGTPASIPKLSNAQISEHYSTCIKLSTENVSVVRTLAIEFNSNILP